MSRRIELKEEMVNRILSATEVLIVREGLQNLSMRNIAKEAGIASGTLYLYFKTKDDLLHSLTGQFFDRYCRKMDLVFNPKLDLFEQYKLAVRRKWAFLLDNLELAHQWKAILGFDELVRNEINNKKSFWNEFATECKKQKIIADLPNELLYSLSIGTIVDILYLQRFNSTLHFEEYLDEIILRTWKAITF
ncbi:AcrR family transcriptional regulator [Mannheimia granulomatis]|uniref:TetR/AcrR family transcriptional regulator n=1 Tax=Mannheimia granulomatis TaxID=85402 RepID=UPI00159DC8B6|nr:TetR/AcrR family transcriptional regulator [Mannheimia granulomatis]QLB14811.1 AcrR family transcriptional regulator [Mannheimia granulomatis]